MLSISYIPDHVLEKNMIILSIGPRNETKHLSLVKWNIEKFVCNNLYESIGLLICSFSIFYCTAKRILITVNKTMSNALDDREPQILK